MQKANFTQVADGTINHLPQRWARRCRGRRSRESMTRSWSGSLGRWSMPVPSGDYPARWWRRAETSDTRATKITHDRHHRKKPCQPNDFGDQPRERFKGSNIDERCFNGLEQLRGIAMRLENLARNYCAAPLLGATLIWTKTD